jgi:hypothetical protein
MKRTLPLVLILAVLATGALYFWSHGLSLQGVDSGARDAEEGLRFVPDPGLVIAYAEAGEVPEDFVGERIVYEAYRVLPPVEQCADEQDLACAIDLRREDVRAYVTGPDGLERELGHDTFYYLVPIYPFSEGGTYAFRVETGSGETFAGSFALSASVPVESPTDASADGSIILFADLALIEHDVVLHVLPENGVLARSPAADGSIAVTQDDVAHEGGHVFLTKVEDVWRHTVLFTPETE